MFKLSWPLRTLLLALLVLVASAADGLAAEIQGRVVGVRDGDTLDLLTPGNVQLRVRLAGIDAPEIGQAYGNVAKRALSALAYNRIARVEWSRKDDYGRVVGKLRVHGDDVNLQMVKRGLAWHYKAYAAEQSAAERKRYAAAEAAARTQRLGLWQDPNPVPPWRFRHRASVRAASGGAEGATRGRAPINRGQSPPLGTIIRRLAFAGATRPGACASRETLPHIKSGIAARD